MWIALLGLAGCPLVTDEDLAGRMDLDGDGVARPDDCDDGDPAVVRFTYYADGDGDGVGGTSELEACTAPSGFVDRSGDCDDTDPALVTRSWHADADADDYGDPLTSTESCDGPVGTTLDATDCDDTRADVHPGARDYCDDGLDNDCNGVIDDLLWTLDADDDNFGDPATAFVSCDPPVGSVSSGTDCDDSDPEINPAALEVCDEAGVDENCDGLVNDDDPAATERTRWYADDDGDGFGAGAGDARCVAPTGTVADSTDCDDDDASVHPAAQETWYDGVDQDCDGHDDYDADRDGAASDAHGGDDCDDDDALVSPRALEACGDAVDNDCDGALAGACRLAGDLPLSSAGATLRGTVAGAWAGAGVVALGDMDNDGYDDFGVTAPRDARGVGVAYLVHGPVTGDADLETEAERVGPCDEQYLGYAVASGGDLDADGERDWLLSAPYTNLEGDWFVEGAVLVFAEGDTSCESAIALRGTDYEYLGTSLAGGRDASGDGVDDVLVGSLHGVALDEAGTNYGVSGAVYLVHGPVMGDMTIPADADLVVGLAAGGSQLGWDVAMVDLDGDGLADLVWADAGESRDLTYAGAVWVLDGATTGSVTGDDADHVIRGASDYEYLRYARDAGDADGDGRDDLLVGTSAWPSATASPTLGAAMIFHSLASAALSSDADALLTGTEAEQGLGTAASGAGDVDGEGRDDLLVGAVYDDTGGGGYGAALLFLAPFAGTRDADDADATFYAEAAYTSTGTAVSRAGDTNGDGFADILVGAPTDSAGGSEAGAAYLFMGGVE